MICNGSTLKPRARAKRPFGSTIAHGFLILSLAAELRKSVGPTIAGHSSALKFGIDGLRFISPVPVGSSIRCRTRIECMKGKSGGTAIDFGIAMNIVGQDRPSLVFGRKLFYRP